MQQPATVIYSSRFGTPTPLKFAHKNCDEGLYIFFRCYGTINVTASDQDSYPDLDALKLELHPKNIVQAISDAAENRTIDDDEFIANPDNAIGTVIENFLSTIGITAKTDIHTHIAPDESREVYNALSLDLIKQNKISEHLPKEPHGELTGCEYFRAANGMMYNSNSYHELTINKTSENTLKISKTDKECFQPEVRKTYTAPVELLKPIAELVERENMAAWEKFKYIEDPNFKMYDYSASSSISLNFNDTSIGGNSHVHRWIDLSATHQRGYGDITKEYIRLLNECVSHATLVKEEADPKEINPFAIGMMQYMQKNGITTNPLLPSEPLPPSPPQEQEIPEGAKICPHCGHPGTGKFCTECGSVL